MLQPFYMCSLVPLVEKREDYVLAKFCYPLALLTAADAFR